MNIKLFGWVFSFGVARVEPVSPAPPVDDLADIDLSFDFSQGSVMDLQDSYLWDWCSRELDAIGVAKGWGRAGGAFIHFQRAVGIKRLFEPGSGQDLIDWILAQEARRVVRRR